MLKGKIFYCGLEPYSSRYTLQLTDWNTSQFDSMGVDYTVINPEVAVPKSINTGDVLDAHGRGIYSLAQNSELLRLHMQGDLTSDDIIFFEDMFTPGMEALAYLFNQVPKEARPKVVVRCLAQTIDPDDFVHRKGMFKWMRHYELMLDSFVDCILCASEEMVSFLRIAGFTSPICVTGLPFGKSEVLSRVGTPNYPNSLGEFTVAYSSRFDQEKQPHFFLDLVYTFKDSPIKFKVLTGTKVISSNDPTALDRIHKYVEAGYLELHENLTKNEYYEHLSKSSVVLNTALQDWVSNTVSEAVTLGCIPLYPAYRSFPEALGHNKDLLYIPWSIEDVTDKLNNLYKLYSTKPSAIDDLIVQSSKIADHQDGTIRRTVECFESISADTLEESPYYRGKSNQIHQYRHYVSVNKL